MSDQTRPRMTWLESVGAALYLGGLIYLCLQPAVAARQQILWIIGAVIAGVSAMSLGHGFVNARTAGLLLATWAVFWQLAVTKMYPLTAPRTLILSGLLSLVGMMLLGRGQRLTPWFGTALGWGSVAAFWLSTRIPFGHFLLVAWGVVIILALYVPRPLSPPQHRSK